MTKPSKDSVERALAGLIAGTRRVKRGLSLARILRHIEILREAFGSLEDVAAAANLSLEMVRQFYSVRNLSPEVMKYVADRRLDGVDVAHRIAKLGQNDQRVVARALLDGNLSSRDVRDVVSYKRSHPKVGIENAISSVCRSRNVRQYVVLLDIRGAKATQAAMRSRVTRALGKDGVVSLDVGGGVMRVVVNENGRKRLADGARGAGLTKREFMQGLLE